ncbi:MAG: hypothetical protein OR997_01940 [Methylophilaceae bacterium]|nr:hypothetical protein [Methylophilaceae bacterium]
MSQLAVFIRDVEQISGVPIGNPAMPMPVPINTVPKSSNAITSNGNGVFLLSLLESSSMELP